MKMMSSNCFNALVEQAVILHTQGQVSNVGASALATLANNPPKDYRNFLQCLNRPVVAVCDNDDAGKKLAKFGDFVEVVPEGKDLGESSEDYVRYLLTKYSGESQ